MAEGEERKIREGGDEREGDGRMGERKRTAGES